MQKQWLEHFCKYRHICEFLGSEGQGERGNQGVFDAGVGLAGSNSVVSDDAKSDLTEAKGGKQNHIEI